MQGLNTAPLALRPFPRCDTCTGQLTATSICHPRIRVFRPDSVDFVLELGDDIAIYEEKDAVSVSCASCIEDLTSCAELTFDTGRLLLFVESGNVYARVAGGRQNQFITLRANITLSSGKIIPITTLLSIER